MISAGLRGVKEWVGAAGLAQRCRRIRRSKDFMTIKVTFPDGSTEVVPGATHVDQQNFHEGRYDFYDERGVLLRQIDMHSQIKWEIMNETDE